MRRDALFYAPVIGGIVGFLCLAACAGDPPQDTPPPEEKVCLMPGLTTLETETLGGNAATRFSVGDTVVIAGSNFSADADRNVVTFDGIPAAVTFVDPADPTRRLFAVIPSGIPGAPAQSADSPKSGVCIQVQTASEGTGATSITVTPPVPSQPTIKTVTPLIQFEGAEITIAGTNFTSEIVVQIRNVNATIVRVSSTEVVVKVPDFPDILPGAVVPSSTKIIHPEASGAAFSGTFRVRGS